MWQTYWTSPRDHCKIESSHPWSDKCCTLKWANNGRCLSVPIGRRINCHFVWTILCQEHMLAWNWNFRHSQCVFCALRLFNGCRSLSQGINSRCVNSSSSHAAQLWQENSRDLFPASVTFDQTLWRYLTVNWECTAAFFFFYIFLFVLKF